MSITFIIGRHTPRQFRIEPASSVSPSDKPGHWRVKRLRASEETLEHAQVMGALSHAMRSIPYSRAMTLKQVFDAAQAGPHARLLSGARYAAATSKGIPARIIVKGDVL